MLMTAVRLDCAGLGSQGRSAMKENQHGSTLSGVGCLSERVQKISKAVQRAWLLAPAIVHEPLTWTSMEKGLQLRVEAVLTL